MAIPDLNRILFVEDDPDIQVIASIALEELGGFTIAVCSSGEEAQAQAPTFAPDLIVLDVMMPGMDGPQTLQSLRSLPQTATTPAIFMTAKVQTHEVQQYKALGAIDVISKPFDPMTLPMLIKDIWERHHGG
jgi:two-component system, OmpR family, response regulator